MVQFPNSKFVPQAQQMLRDVQEVLAEKEFLTGDFYHKRGSFPAAANRLLFVRSSIRFSAFGRSAVGTRRFLQTYGRALREFPRRPRLRSW